MIISTWHTFVGIQKAFLKASSLSYLGLNLIPPVQWQVENCNTVSMWSKWT